MPELYETIKIYERPGKEARVLQRNLTLDEARKYCDDPETSSMTATPPNGYGGDERKIQAWHDKEKHWFVGYRRQ